MINDDNTNTKSIIDYDGSELEGIRPPTKSTSTIINNNTVNNVNSPLNTSAINVDVNNSKGGNAIFVFDDNRGDYNKEDNKLLINVNYALEHCPIIQKHISTSKITFPGSGLAAMATSLNNLEDITKTIYLLKITSEF